MTTELTTDQAAALRIFARADFPLDPEDITGRLELPVPPIGTDFATGVERWDLRFGREAEIRQVCNHLVRLGFIEMVTDPGVDGALDRDAAFITPEGRTALAKHDNKSG